MSYKEHYFSEILSCCRELDEAITSPYLFNKDFNEDDMRRLFLRIGIAYGAIEDKLDSEDTFLSVEIAKMHAFSPEVLETHNITKQWVLKQGDWLCSSDLLERLSFMAGEENGRLRVLLDDMHDSLKGSYKTLNVHVRKSWLCLGVASLSALVFTALLMFDWRMIIPACISLIGASPFARPAITFFTTQRRLLDRENSEDLSEAEMLKAAIFNTEGDIAGMKSVIEKSANWMVAGYFGGAVGLIASAVLGILFSLHITV